MDRLRMRNLYLLSVLILMLSLSVVPNSLADPSELQSLLHELQSTAGQTSSLSSQFVQEKRLEIFAETLVSQGRFAYQQPDHLRWELLTPMASGFVLRGANGERWNSLSHERSNFSVANDPIMGMIAQQLMAWARVDLYWLQARYHMELQSVSPLRLRLTPLDKGEAGFISQLQIQFSEDRTYVVEVLLLEQGGDSTLLRFNEVQLNTPLPATTFQPPAPE